LGVNRQKKSELVDNSKSTKRAIEKKFFEYKAIDYYTNDFDESKIGDKPKKHFGL
jgi:hypothetical protein